MFFEGGKEKEELLSRIQMNLIVRGLSVRGEQTEMTNSGILSYTYITLCLTSRPRQLLSLLFSKFLNMRIHVLLTSS